MLTVSGIALPDGCAWEHFSSFDAPCGAGLFSSSGSADKLVAQGQRRLVQRVVEHEAAIPQQVTCSATALSVPSGVFAAVEWAQWTSHSVFTGVLHSASLGEPQVAQTCVAR